MVGNLLYYALNTKHPLFKELKMIVFKTVGVEGSLRSTLSSIHGIRVAFIYGSYAGKKEKGSSDIDLMIIIGNPDTSLLNEKIAELKKRLKREINPTIYPGRISGQEEGQTWLHNGAIKKSKDNGDW